MPYGILKVAPTYINPSKSNLKFGKSENNDAVLFRRNESVFRHRSNGYEGVIR